MNPQPGGLRFKHIPLANANVMHEQFAGFLYWCIYLLFLFLFSEPKVSRRQIVPEDFCVFVDASTAEEQSDIDVKIELTVYGQNCEAQCADVLEDHVKHIKESIRLFLTSPYK